MCLYVLVNTALVCYWHHDKTQHVIHKADYITTFGTTYLTALLHAFMLKVMILSVIMLCVAVQGRPTHMQPLWGLSPKGKVPHTSPGNVRQG